MKKQESPGFSRGEQVKLDGKPPSASNPALKAEAPGVRALAPDLARGFMLLLIAIANSTWYLWGHTGNAYSSHPTDGTLLDRILHAALLFAGDILGAYGLVALLLVWIFFERSDATLKVWAGLIVGFSLLFSLLSLISGVWVTASGLKVTTFLTGDFRDSMSGNPNYLASVSARLADWLQTPFVGLLTGIIPAAILLGWLLARHRVLEEPARHRRGLVLLAAIGIPVGWIGGVPTALAVLGWPLLPEGAAWAFMFLTATTGLAAGLGYVALFALVALRLGENPGRITTAIAAVGKRSLSFYLFQSILFAPLLSAWGLGWGASINTTGAVCIAVGIWVVAVMIAGWMEHTNRRGPFEILLRRLTYGGGLPPVGVPRQTAGVPRSSSYPTLGS